MTGGIPQCELPDLLERKLPVLLGRDIHHDILLLRSDTARHEHCQQRRERPVDLVFLRLQRCRRELRLKLGDAGLCLGLRVAHAIRRVIDVVGLSRDVGAVQQR